MDQRILNMTAGQVLENEEVTAELNLIEERIKELGFE